MEKMTLTFVENGLDHQTWTIRRITAHLRSPKTVTFAIRHGDRLSAFLMMQIERKKAHLDLVVVTEHYRKGGIGRRLVEEALKFATASEAIEMNLEVRENNTDAQRFYQKLGFQRVGETERYYCAKETALLFSCRLETT
jgi:ribosomal-protein-alanine acetyltransferase